MRRGPTANRSTATTSSCSTTPTTATYFQLDENGEPVVDEESGAEVFLFDLVGTSGYDYDRHASTCSDDGKTITVTYAEPYADWQSLFSGQIPAHVIERESGVDDLVAAFEADDAEAINAVAETYNTLYTVNPGEINPDTMLSGGKYALGNVGARRRA